MICRDSLGRARRPTQNSGLRPLHPPLPTGLRLRSVRVAMSDPAWTALDRSLADSPEPTRPRALGQLLERALGTGPVVDWQTWQIRKEKQLLGIDREAS